MLRIKINHYFIIFLIFLIIGLVYTQDINLNVLQNIQNNPDLQAFTMTTNLAINLPIIEDTVIGKGVKYTIFAPIDQAYAKAKSISENTINNMIRYHIVPIEAKSSTLNNIQYQPTLIDSKDLIKLGDLPNPRQKLIIKNDNGVITVGNGYITGKVVGADNLASNGVIQIIDTIIPLPDSPMKTMNQITDINDFAKVITGANLATTFENYQGITIFAPSNSALAKAPQSLFSTGNLTQLTSFLNYHVVPKVLFSGVIMGPSNQATQGGSSVKVSNEGNVMKVNGVNVITPDILLNNGVLHIIEEYLVPPGMPIPTPTSDDKSPTPTGQSDNTPSPPTPTPTAPNQIPLYSKKNVIISSVLGGIIGMVGIAICLLIFLHKQKKIKSDIDVKEIKTISTINTPPESILPIPSDRDSNATTYVTQRSSSNYGDNMANMPYSPNNQVIYDYIDNVNHPYITNNVPMNNADGYGSDSNIVGGSSNRNPTSSNHSETSSDYGYGGPPYNPRPTHSSQPPTPQLNPFELRFSMLDNYPQSESRSAFPPPIPSNVRPTSPPNNYPIPPPDNNHTSSPPIINNRPMPLPDNNHTISPPPLNNHPINPSNNNFPINPPNNNRPMHPPNNNRSISPPPLNNNRPPQSSFYYPHGTDQHYQHFY